MNLKKAISVISVAIEDPTVGLPEEVFLFISRITPLLNVDLLIKNKKHQTLLTWRKDNYYPAGWHIPGGIIRYKEKISNRVKAVAKTELGVKIKSDFVLLSLNEYIHPTRRDRGHGISLLYECMLTSPLDKRLEYKGGTPKHGEWAWHDDCPENIMSVHEIYRKFIDHASADSRRVLVLKRKVLKCQQ